VLTVIIISTHVAFGEYDIIFTNSQPRLGTGKIKNSCKFSEIKAQKT